MSRVLIVEDDPMVTMILGQYVERQKGFSVAGTCDNGETALAFLTKEPVPLVLLDVRMPGMDGFTLLRELRYRQIDTDVILVTAAHDRQALTMALRCGCIDYLVKPFTYERFCLAMEKYTALTTMLCGGDTFPQKAIDRLLGTTQRLDTSLRKSGDHPPKGIQEKTLARILEYMEDNSGTWHTGEEIASHVGLTSVTVRRYMQYLEVSGKVTGEMDYATGGRPCMRYQL